MPLTREFPIPTADDVYGRRGAPPIRNALVPVEPSAFRPDGDLPIVGYTPTPIGLVPQEGVTFEQWVTTGKTLFQIETGLQWLIGDWLLSGVRDFDYAIEQVAADLNRDAKTLQNWARITAKFAYSRRRVSLFFGHHEAVIGLKNIADQDLFLDLAERNHWNVQDLRRQMRAAKRRHLAPSAKPKPSVIERRFKRRWTKFSTQLDLDLKDATTRERREVAEALRQKADAIEKGQGE